MRKNNVAVFEIVNGKLSVCTWNPAAGKWFENYDPSRVAGNACIDDAEAVRLVKATGFKGRVFPKSHPVAQLLPFPKGWSRKYSKVPKWLA